MASLELAAIAAVVRALPIQGCSERTEKFFGSRAAGTIHRWTARAPAPFIKERMLVVSDLLFGFEVDGSQTLDGRCTLTSNGVNRLMQMRSMSDAPSGTPDPATVPAKPVARFYASSNFGPKPQCAITP